MARLSQGILGGISGTIGNVVGSSWKGIAIVKTKPLSVANPKTAGQIRQRTKMSNAVSFAKLILASTIKPMWDRFAQQASGYNDFISENISLFTDAMPNPANQLVISKGQMLAVDPNSLGGNAGATIVPFGFPDDLPDALSLADDDVYVVLVNETQGIVGFSSAQVERSDSGSSVTLREPLVSGDVLNLYLAFRRKDGTVVSNTGFITNTVA